MRSRKGTSMVREVHDKSTRELVLGRLELRSCHYKVLLSS